MSTPTLTDVARAAGVSVSTASIAFSGSGPIAAETRERVLAAAARLHYSGPNPAGRQLRSGRYDVVGVVVGDHLRRSFRDPVSIQVIDGLAGTLAELGFGILLIPGACFPTANNDYRDPLLESAGMDVAVMIWGAQSPDPRVDILTRRKIPMVIGEGNAIPGASLVGIDDRQGVAEIARYLKSLGHTRFGTITLPFRMGRHAGWVDDLTAQPIDWTPTRNRLAGLADAGVTPVAVYETEASVLENGISAAREILDPKRYPDRSQRPTAIIAQSDILAAGAVLAARELGLRVPEDVSIAGFDGIDLPWLEPEVLTTVTQPLEEKGSAMARAVSELLKTGEATQTFLPVSLRVGTTTGPPPR